MNTKVFAFPQPSILSKVNLYQDSKPESHDHPINASLSTTNKHHKNSSVPGFQSRPHFTTVLLNKTNKAGPELNLDIQHLGGGSKRPLLHITSEVPFENLGMPHSRIPSSRMTVTRGGQNNKLNLPNLNMTTTNYAAPKTVFEMFRNLMDPVNEIRGIEGVKLNEKKKELPSKPVPSRRPLTRKNTLENSLAEAVKKLEPLPLVLSDTFRKEQGEMSNKLTKRSNTGSISQDEEDDDELQTAQIFSHHMEENGRSQVKSLNSIDNLHFRKNIRKIFRSQGAKDSHRSIDDHLNTTASQNDVSTITVNKRELKRGTSNSHNSLPVKIETNEDSLQGWNCIRPVRIVSGKSVRSDSHQPIKQNFAIKTYQGGVMKAKKRVVTCVTEIDAKIAKIFNNHRTLEQNILSPLNESSSSEDDNFAEYVEAIKAGSEENILRST